MLKVCIPKDQDRIKRQIKALKWQLTQDTNDKDKEIHLNAIKSLELALK